MAGLFSARVATFCGIPTELDEPLHPLEQSAVAQAVEKRRLDFAAGRACARRALRQLGIEDAAIPVGERREPRWPDGIIGSLSHTRGFCGAAVARQTDVKGLGFDVERISEVRLELRSHIATDDELDELHALVGGPREQALALAFSAREAFYKFQYPLSGQWVGLRDVTVRADADGFLVVPSIDVAGVCPKGGSVRGRFLIHGNHLLAGIELPV